MEHSTGSATGSSVAPLEARTVVFLSHATPENNAIASWFGARLTAAGYLVWSDLKGLLGGEEMWTDIDSALRQNARKVIALLSKQSVQKDGFLAELHRAEAIRKRLGDRRFIVPVRIDDIDFDDVPATVANRTIVDASKNLADGLSVVLKILEEDRVHRETSYSSNALQKWQVRTRAAASLDARSETLITNWLPLLRLPEALNVYSIEKPLSNPLTEPASIASSHPLPMFAHFRQLVSFGCWHEVQAPIAETVPVKLQRTISLECFLSGGDQHFQIDAREARKHMQSVLRQAFDRFASAKGLLPYSLSVNSKAWWVPGPDNTQSEKIHFTRPSGVPGWRVLCGEYGPRKRRWHFGMAAVPIMGEVARLKISPHVIFTDPLGREPPTAQYRRAMCKMWFNGKWRDLNLAMLQYLSEGSETLSLPLGEGLTAQVSSRAFTLDYPLGIPASAEKKTPLQVSDDGDAEDIDQAEREADPVFSSLADDDDLEVNVEEDA